MAKEYVKCPVCREKIKTGINNMSTHLIDSHEDDIPKDMTPEEYYYRLLHKGQGKKCMVCKKETKWNEAVNKFNPFCSTKCKDAYVALARSRMLRVHKTVSLLNNPDHQRKMLANRKISGKYIWSDGSGIKTYTGSYELDFVRMTDIWINLRPEDVEMPSPHTYTYMYKGEEKFYIPDAFIHSLQLECEIKDGGDNPNGHHKIQEVDKEKEKLKDEVMLRQKDFHYIKICNKDYTQFFGLFKALRDDELDETERLKKIKILGK